jgi:hypothetical protein
LSKRKVVVDSLGNIVAADFVDVVVMNLQYGRWEGGGCSDWHIVAVDVVVVAAVAVAVDVVDDSVPRRSIDVPSGMVWMVVWWWM